MLSQMQATLKRKQEAFQTLDSKSKALKKGIEPRNAYNKKGEKKAEEAAGPYESQGEMSTI
jgi:hypothetical protein